MSAPLGRITIDDPRADDVRAMLGRHLTFANLHSAPEDVHALDVEALAAPDVSFYSLRTEGGDLLGVGALKRLDDDHAEIKSMHTAEAARGRGVARAMAEHLVATARHGGFSRVSLETGSQDAFAPARSLYASLGFEPCEAFADYVASTASAYMTLAL